MVLYAPKYYLDFKCIADKCTHSCCIGWEIDIDQDTAELYKNLDGEYGKEILKSVDFIDTPHFVLGENERCPHLDGQGLCKIISTYGEDCLCEICREHPRFYNDTPRGKEVGLGMACEEACRLILNSNNYDEFIEINGADVEIESTAFNPTLERAYIYKVLKDYSLSYSDRLQELYKKYNVSPFLCKDKEWQNIISSLEYLDPRHKELLCGYSSTLLPSEEQQVYLERALAYFIYRHCSEACDYGEFVTALGFCFFLERLLAYVAQKTGNVELSARIVSEEIEYSLDNTETIKMIFY